MTVTVEQAETPAPPRMPVSPWLTRVGSGLVSGLLVVATVVAVAIAVVPRVFDGAALTLLSGSMQPTYAPGDVVVIARVAPSDIQPGDVVTFQATSGDPALTTHRVVALQLGSDGQTRFITRGDANGSNDDPLVSDQIVGRVVYHLPYVGHLTVWAGDHRRTLAMGAGAALLLYAGGVLLRPRRARSTT